MEPAILSVIYYLKQVIQTGDMGNGKSSNSASKDMELQSNA